MDDFDGLGKIVPVLIAVIWVVTQVVRAATSGKKAPQQPPRRGPQQQEPPVAGRVGPPKRGRHGEVFQQDAGQEIHDVLERLRDQAGAAGGERPEPSPKALASEQRSQAPGSQAAGFDAPGSQAAGSQAAGFDAPGRIAETVPADRDDEEVQWDDYDWEPVEPEPLRRREAQQTPPPLPLLSAGRPGRATRASSPLEGATDIPPIREAQRSSEESLFGAGWSAVGDESSGWLTISDIVNTTPSETIRGVPIDEAMAIREILAKPRATTRWRPGGFYNV